MGLVRVIDPAAEPITRAEAKSHLRVEHTNDDDLIDVLISAATGYVEEFTGRQLVEATWKLTLDEFSETIRLPRPPLISVDSIEYVDVDGATQTLTVMTDYYVDDRSFLARIKPAYGESWPSTREVMEAVIITYTCGYARLEGVGSGSGSGSGDGSESADYVPDAIKAAIKLLVADMYEHREARLETRIEDNPTVLRLLWPYRVISFDQQG